MRQAQKKAVIAVGLVALLTTSVGCAVHDYDDRYRYGRDDRNERYSRMDLDRDGRVEQWERDRWDRDRDGRVERWERDRGPSSYYGRDNWRYDRHSDSTYRDRFDR